MSVKTVNKTLLAMSINAELVKGKGYFYLAGEATEGLRTTMMYVNKFSDMTDSQWIEEIKNLLAENNHNFY